MAEERGRLELIGSLWVKDGRNGKFMSGELELAGRDGPRTPVLVFKNTPKNGEELSPRAPKYKVYRVAQEPDQEQGRAPSCEDEEF